jgi:hypothetical protein
MPIILTTLLDGFAAAAGCFAGDRFGFALGLDLGLGACLRAGARLAFGRCLNFVATALAFLCCLIFLALFFNDDCSRSICTRSWSLTLLIAHHFANMMQYF